MGRLAIGESVQVSDYLAEYETLQTFFRVADERSHRAPSAVVDEHGTVLSHPDYVDRMGVAHQRAGAWAFCRAQAAEAFGLTSGTDWIRHHNLHLLFHDGSPYLTKPHLYSQLYIQRFGSSESQMLVPVREAGPVAWSDDGSRICVLEERLGHVTDGTDMAGFRLWEYELSVGSRRLVAGFPVTDRLGVTDLTYSADAAWIHICDWTVGRNLLVRASDGLVVPLPVRSAAVAFNPRRDAGDMTVITIDQPTGDAIIHDYDLAAAKLTERSRLITPTGLPMRVRELAISPRGEAVVTAPVGVTGLEQLERGDIHIAAYLDIDTGEIEPVLSVSFRTPGAQRRHTSPRWCDDRAIVEPTPLVIADRLMEQGAVRRCAPDNERVINDQTEHVLEVMNGIEAAWRSGTIPSHRFAQEFVQYAIALRDIDPDRVEPPLAKVRQRAYRDPVAREVLQRIKYGRRGWVPLASTGIPTPDQPMPAPPDPAVVDDVAHALLDLIAARRRPEAAVAIRSLLVTA